LLDQNKNLIDGYHAGLWNRWDDTAVDEIFAPGIKFWGALGVTVSGPDGFRGYVARVRAAIPDFHNQIDELLAEGETVPARLTYSATHQGELYRAALTGKRLEYGGTAFFRICEGQITGGLVHGDTMGVDATDRRRRPRYFLSLRPIQL
jgi:predicted ester cyclase